MDESNNNPVQGGNENGENNNPIQENNANNNPIQENSQSNNSNIGESNAQQQNNNYSQNVNSVNGNQKKKSKAPIIIIIVVIVLLLLGCLVSGVIFFGIKFYNDNIKNSIVENKINMNSIVNDVKNTNTTNTIKNNTSNTTRNTIANNTTNTASNTVTNNVITGDAKTSTKESPLSKGEWGIASKYSTETKEYENVNVKVTNFTRGEDAKKAVQDYMTSGSSIYKYQDPKEGLEWLVIDYDVDFADYTMSSVGANGDVSGKVEGLTSSSIKYNGTTYITSTIFIGPRDYVKTKNTSGRLATQVPIGCSDYIVTFGAYNEAKAYFKGE